MQAEPFPQSFRFGFKANIGSFHISPLRTEMLSIFTLLGVREGAGGEKESLQV
jgi:hypothetical protein